MLFFEHDNTEQGNVYSIPPDFGFPLAAAILLFFRRRYERAEAAGAVTPARAA